MNREATYAKLQLSVLECSYMAQVQQSFSSDAFQDITAHWPRFQKWH